MLLSAPSRRRTRLGAIPLLFLTVLGLLVGGLGAPAYAAAGSITGTVTRAGALAANTPLAGVTVSLLNENGSPVMTTTGTTPAPVTTTTGANGGYTLATPNTTGTVSYKVKFGGTGFVEEFHNNAATAAAATPVPVADGATVTGVDAAVARSDRSEVGGKVTTADGSAISGAKIVVYKRGAVDANTGQPSYDPPLDDATAEKATTAVDGTWKLDLPLGKYVIGIKAPAYNTAYYDGDAAVSGTDNSARTTASPQTAGEVEVGIGEATPLRTAKLTQATGSGTSISGRVTSNGVNVENIEISVEYSQLDANGQTTWTEVQSSKAKTAANGTYTALVPAVSQGRTYVVGFKGAGFRTRYYKANSSPAFTREDATRLSPGANTALTGINVDLPAATQVVGKVSDSAGVGLRGVTVNAVTYTPDGAEYGSWKTLTVGSTPVTTQTLPDGTYVLEVPADTPFRLEFKSTDQRPTRYFPSGAFPDEGTNLSLAPNTALTGRDITLPTASTVRGSLTETTGAAYGGAGTVSAWKEVTWSELGEKGGTTHTSWFEVPGSAGQVTNGAFTVQAPAGSYRLKFVDAATDEIGFLPGLVGLDQAPDVVLGAEQTLTGQGYQMPSQQTVRGRVTDLALDPKVDMVVAAEYTYITDIRDGVKQPSAVIGPKAPGTRQTRTQTDGLYTLALRSRTYRVYGFNPADPDGTGPLTQGPRSFFGDLDETGAQAPRDVVVSNSDLAGIDITLSGDGLTNTRAPWITGLADPGATLTAQPGNWTPEAGLSFNYEWSYKALSATNDPDDDDQEPFDRVPSSSTPASGWTTLVRSNANATNGLGNPSVDGRTLAIPSDGPFCFPPVSSEGCAENVRYRVKVTPVVNGTPDPAKARFGQYRTQTLSDTTPADERRARPLVIGKAVVGETLSTDSGVWAQQSTYTYQWFRGSAEIAGATQSTYVPVPADVGFNLRVQVVPTASPNLEPAVSVATARVGGGTITNTKAPLINGKAQVGETLTANTGSWSPEPTSFSYVWSANGQPIPGATGSTYKPVEGDVAKVIRVQVTAKRDGYTAATTSSDPTGAVSLDGTDPTKLVNRNKPVIEGTPQVGRTLTAKSGDWTNQPTFTYQWQADGVDIANASTTTYVLKAADEGKAISVRVTARRSGFDSVTVSSDPSNPVAKGVFTNPVKPSVSGLTRPGSTVTALTGTFNPSEGTSYGYQWLLDNVNIPGATTATYTVKESDLEKLLSVRVTASAPGYADLTSVSDAVRVTPTGDTSLDVVQASVINGNAVVGQTLRLTVGATNPTFDTVAIQWLRNGIPVAGRTGTSYAVTEADLGAPVAARVTYKKTGYIDEVETVTTDDVTEPVNAAKPEIDVVKKIKGDKLVLKVTVSADTQDPVRGDVELTENGKFLKSGALVDGKRKLVVKGLKKGFHSVKVAFLGNDLVKQKSKTISFTIR